MLDTARGKHPTLGLVSQGIEKGINKTDALEHNVHI